MNLRKEAKGRDCQIRLPGVCRNDRSTVVLCHIHKPSISGGMGLKANDALGTHGCYACHAACDGRTKAYDSFGILYTFSPLLLAFYEGCFRTQKILFDEGKIAIT